MPDGKTYDDNTLECAEQMKKCYKCFRAENLRLVPDSMLQILGDCGLTPSCASSVNPPAKIGLRAVPELILAASAGWRKPVPD